LEIFQGIMEERWNENEFVGVGSDFLILEE
jgi:hypothetical protein